MGNILNKVPEKNKTSLMGFIDEDYVEFSKNRIHGNLQKFL